MLRTEQFVLSLGIIYAVRHLESVQAPFIIRHAELHRSQVQIAETCPFVIPLDAPSGGGDLANEVLYVVTDAVRRSGVYSHFV